MPPAHNLPSHDSTGLLVFKANLVSKAAIFECFYGDLDDQTGHPLKGKHHRLAPAHKSGGAKVGGPNRLPSGNGPHHLGELQAIGGGEVGVGWTCQWPLLDLKERCLDGLVGR